LFPPISSLGFIFKGFVASRCEVALDRHEAKRFLTAELRKAFLELRSSLLDPSLDLSPPSMGLLIPFRFNQILSLTISKPAMPMKEASMTTNTISQLTCRMLAHLLHGRAAAQDIAAEISIQGSI
jgi:hypothetical protein